jgi:Kef-type K+ transport system membrane component KefB
VTGLAPLLADAGPGDLTQHVLATLAAVLLVGLLLGRLLRWLGQPPVIGEILAGLVLGPSVLGAVCPAAMDWLMSSPDRDPYGQVQAALGGISQLGIAFYMFLVGLELSFEQVRRQLRPTLAIALSSMVVPMVLGIGLAVFMHARFAGPNVPPVTFALFVGLALAITAFPVLARIVTDRGMERSELGVLALGCAAVGDLIAWCLLAFVVGVAEAKLQGTLPVMLGAGAFVTFMMLVVRPLLAWLISQWEAGGGEAPAWAPAAFFILVLLAALATHIVGIHAVFGAFLLGLVMPHDSRFAHTLAARVREPVTLLLMPAFFAFTGMRTELRLVAGWESWLFCLAIVSVAMAGKVGGTYLAARRMKQGRSDAVALGVLMNCRGLMELIVLNIGLDLGLITPSLYAMMVIMALVTTLSTAPLLRWCKPDRR